MFASHTKKYSKQHYEEGRVSVHEFDPRTGLFRETLSVFGRSTAGRLGASVASLGDLDGDGRGDFAAGAPFEDGGRGAVHVFLGKADVESIQGESFWRVL